MILKFYLLFRAAINTFCSFSPHLFTVLALLVAITASPLSLQAQSRRVDSLTGLLATSLPDTQRINTLCELANNLSAYKPDKAQTYAQEALQLSEKWDYLEGKTQALHLIGTIYWKQNKKDKAISYLHRSLQIAQNTDNQIIIYKSTSLLKDYYRTKKKYDSVLYFYDINTVAEETLFDKDKARIIKALADELHNEALKQKEIECLQKENYQKAQIIEQQTIIEYSLVVGLLLLSALGFVVYKNYRQKEQLKFNKQMEEIGDIASHQLRSPVASILGLLNIYNRENPADPENELVIKHLDKSAQQLDTMVREIVKKTYLS
jgi:tetratricopeptide (TPR) repeat protein